MFASCVDHTIGDEAEARDTVATVLANNPHPRRVVVRRAVDWSDQPPPLIDLPRAGAADAAASTAAPLLSGGLGEIEPQLARGGFRCEYDDAVDTLETTYETTLKQLYDAELITEEEYATKKKQILDQL